VTKIYQMYHTRTKNCYIWIITTLFEAWYHCKHMAICFSIQTSIQIWDAGVLACNNIQEAGNASQD